MKKYTLLIFDWDGTLIDSKAQIVQCMQAAIATQGLEERSKQQISDIIGLGLEQAIQQLYPALNTAQIKQTSMAYRERYLAKETQASPLFHGSEQVLKTLKQQGYELAVATGKSRRGLDRDLADTGLAHYFPITRCADETRSKPHPQMLEEILVDYNTPASNALMIGDSEYDLLLAQNAKVDGFAVSYGVHDLLRLLKHHPVGFIDDIKQLPEWLEKHNDSKTT